MCLRLDRMMSVFECESGRGWTDCCDHRCDLVCDKCFMEWVWTTVGEWIGGSRSSSVLGGERDAVVGTDVDDGRWSDYLLGVEMEWGTSCCGAGFCGSSADECDGSGGRE